MIEWAPVVYTLLILLYAALLDVKSREIPPRYWLLVVPLGLPLTLIAYRDSITVLLVYQALSLAVIAVTYVMYRACMIGGADVLAFLAIAILAPRLPDGIIPSLYLSILYASIPGFAYQLYSAILACQGFKIPCVLGLKFKVKARLILEDQRFKWWLVESRGDCSIESDPRELALKASNGNLEAYIVASPGHPYIAHLTIGYMLSMILGDKPLLYITTVITGMI